jgi:hypothetical protein
MFKFSVKSWWDGDALRERLAAEHRAGIRALAEFVAERARMYCPVDTGELRASIQVVSEADGMRHHVIASARHAEPVEWGYRHYLSGRQVPPQPFLRKSLNDGMRAMPQFLGRSRFAQGFHHGRLPGATFQ